MVTSAAPPISARRWTRSRLLGHALLLIWVFLGCLFAWMLVAGYDTDKIVRYMPGIFEGLWVTVKLVGLSVFFGALLSIPIAAGRLSHNRLVGGLSFSYSYFFRGTPLLAQTFLVYYGAGEFSAELKQVGLWWFFRDAFNCALFTFTLNTAAYQAEILAGSIKRVPRGQWQAADALGLKSRVTLLKIILPQALITALRPYGNEIILMIKGSAIASVITVFDLMGQTRYAYSKTYDIQVYLWAAIIYLAMVELLRRLWDRLEARLTRHLQRNSN
jgi:polar amino acid transport system permease protein